MVPIIQDAEKQLLGLIKVAGLPVRASYRRSEVCRILGVSDRTFWSMASRYEPNPKTGVPVDPASLNSYMLQRERRVTFHELVAYLKRNSTYDRLHAQRQRR